MRLFPFFTHNGVPHRPLQKSLLLAAILLFGSAGCRKTVRTADPQLKPVQELLDAQLPTGTSEEKVKAFLAESGCVVLPPQKPGTVVAIIPATRNHEASNPIARAIFYFDANGKLNTFELARASGGPAQR